MGAPHTNGRATDDPAFLRAFYGLPAQTADADVLAYVEVARSEFEAGREADAARARLAALDHAMGVRQTVALRPAVTLHEAALHGLAGETVRALRPHTEACDGAVLSQYLAVVSSCVGRSPHVAVGPARQPARLFVLVVGSTGRGRKGTALDAALAPFLHPTGPRFPRRVSNVQSGEAIIEAVRDGEGDEPGVEDKRLLCKETEFGNVFAAKGRAGSILTGVLRQGWDSGDLHNTKIKSVQATGAHVVVVGHITADELHDVAGRTDTANGFLNRFQFAHAQAVRSIPLPEPPPDDVLGVLASCLSAAIQVAKSRGRVHLSGPALGLWRQLYPHLDADDEGAVGALLARTKPYLLRLALVYALLDRADKIEPVHLHAACALWDYHTATIHHVYGGRTGNRLDDRLLSAIVEAGGAANRTALSGALSRHVTAAALDAARDRLVAAGVVEIESVKTAGRPREVWRTCEQSERSRRASLTSLCSHFAPEAGSVVCSLSPGARIQFDGDRVGVVTTEPTGGRVSVEAGGLPFTVPLVAVRTLDGDAG